MAEVKGNETKVGSKQRLTDRYRKSRPEMNWDDEAIDNDVEGLAADELEEMDKDKAARAEMDSKMNALFNSNPQASKIFIGWANGNDPIENLVELFGDDLIEALNSEEGKIKFKAALEKWRKGREADDEHGKAYDANIAQSGKNLVAFADKNGLSDEEVTAIAMKLHEIGSDVLEGLYKEEYLDMVYKAGNYDTAVEEAREEGRVNGKNENIRRELRKSKPATGLPPTAGGQDVLGSEAPVEKPKVATIAALGGIPIRRK